jgi:DNA-binding response OmpR family regulator
MNKTILVVEDEPDIRGVIELILSRRGFNVVTSETGLNFNELFHTVKPALILLDVLLPDKSGLEICEEIKKEYNVPVILITAYYFKDHLKNSNADAFIEKPFDVNDLVEIVNKFL